MVFIDDWVFLGFGLLIFYVLYHWNRLDFKNQILDHENKKLKAQLNKHGGEKLK